jgi:hypothetical protein
VREQLARLGPDALQLEFDKWDKFVLNHPEHIAKLASDAAAWDEANAEKHARALRRTRAFVPPNVWRCVYASDDVWHIRIWSLNHSRVTVVPPNVWRCVH